MFFPNSHLWFASSLINNSNINIHEGTIFGKRNIKFTFMKLISFAAIAGNFLFVCGYCIMLSTKVSEEQ